MFLAELDEAGNQAKTYTLGNEYAGHVSELNNSLTSENKAASYYITDEQGSIRYILDQSGEVLNFYQYSAFGETIISEETTPNRLRYNAQTEDELTGLYYLRARYYAPDIGRFIQEDVIYNDGLNLYAYCNSNPVMYSDPSGFAKETCKSKVGGECNSGNISRLKINHLPLAKPGEDLYVGTYSKSSYWNKKTGLNKTHTPHHVVQDAVSSVSHGKGITINIRKDIHVNTETYGSLRTGLTNRQHLAADIAELRVLLKEQGYSRSTINAQLNELIKQNKALGGFEK